MKLADHWQDFELLDAGDGEKLERWGDYILQRPDPQAIWPHDPWPQPDALYHRSAAGGGYWQKIRPLPATWEISYRSASSLLTYRIEPTGFKHTGLFPEQAVNWDFCAEKIQQAAAAGRQPRILNLFAYTGGATVACAAAGASEVVHLDASKGMNARARENLTLSGLQDRYVRFFSDDAQKFVDRESRRGRLYDGIIMDPPAYGRGPGGELWKLEDAVYGLVEHCAALLSDQPLFFILNSYTTGLAPTVLADILGLVIRPRLAGRTEAYELGLPASRRDLILPCGCTGRWQP
ncbi:MAG: class I SAM-dependent methyltransferase [Clostridiaceae bacterium]|nr:class I SAM-dependent methyltransferase [Clostridiaceae bacterium]